MELCRFHYPETHLLFSSPEATAKEIKQAVFRGNRSSHVKALFRKEDVRQRDSDGRTDALFVVMLASVAAMPILRHFPL